MTPTSRLARSLRLASVVVLGLLAVGCGGTDDDSSAANQDAAPADAASVTASDSASAAPGELVPGMTWQWQLQGDLNSDYAVDLYDIDLFDTGASQIAGLQRDGRLVICYFSAGSYEQWRDDAAEFEADTVGETLDGWEDERWLDIRSPSVRQVLTQRLDLAVTKGCDGVEPDNVTAKNNNTGFAISSDDQLDFNRWLAETAHDRGLLIGLKNDLDQIVALVDSFDFAVNEECHEFDECDVYAAFIDAGKPVLNAEYAAPYREDPADLCRRSAEAGFSTLILDIELDDSYRAACP